MILCLMAVCGDAQTDHFIVSEIILNGIEHTHSEVIHNELDFTIGDTIFLTDFPDTKLRNEKRLLGTALFTSCMMNVKNWDFESQTAEIHITFQENWYIYPSLIFELADRNFNVWWTDQNKDISRVNYGLGLEHINLTGKKDKLKLKIQHGYTPKYEIKYYYPYISNTWGAFGEIFYANQKEIGYKTVANKTVFEKAPEEQILLNRFRAGLGIKHRPNVYNFHDFKIEYHHNSIDKWVLENLTADYFLNGKADLRFFAFKYDYIWDKRVFNLYPEGGYQFFVNVTKEGFGIFNGINNLSMTLGYERHLKFDDRWIWEGRFKGKVNILRNKVAFANNTGLGYGNDVVRGYELYVVDGTDWVLAKSSLRYKVLEMNHNWGKYMLLKQLKKMNFRLFLRANLDVGYVHEPTYTYTNTLNNRWLIGTGPAVDILLYHTFILSIEYSFNHIGESGLFLKSSFNF